MIEVSRSLPVNDGGAPELSTGDVRDWLAEKAGNPLPCVHSISECRVTERFDQGLVRDIIHAGQPVRRIPGDGEGVRHSAMVRHGPVAPTGGRPPGRYRAGGSWSSGTEAGTACRLTVNSTSSEMTPW